MSIWKRAYLYIVRKKVRSLLLFLIFLVSGLFLLTGISIRQGAGEAAEDFKKTLKTGLTLKLGLTAQDIILEEREDENGELVFTHRDGLLRESHLKEILAIEGVSGVYRDNFGRETGYTGLLLRPGYQAWCQDIIDGKIPVEGEVTKEFRDYLIEECRKATEVGMHTNSFLEVYDSEWHPAFVNGAVELVEGRHIRMDDKKKVVISDEVAERNGLKVGDKITAQWTDIFSGEFFGRAYETEIAGIFHINFEQKVTPDLTYEEDIMANMFFCTTDLWRFHTRDYQIEYGMPVFAPISDELVSMLTIFVEDPSLLDAIKEKLLDIESVEWDLYEFGRYDRDYQTAAAPLLSMKKISGLLAVIPAVGVLIILYLVLTIWMRSRKHEIGILSSVGVKKRTILLQFLTECCCIAAVSFFAALLLAGPVTRRAGDGLQNLFYASGETEKYELEVEMETDKVLVNMTPPAKGEALPYAVTPKEACMVFLLLMGTAVLSVLVSSGKMLNQKPGEILRS